MFQTHVLALSFIVVRSEREHRACISCLNVVLYRCLALKMAAQWRIFKDFITSLVDVRLKKE